MTYATYNASILTLHAFPTRRSSDLGVKIFTRCAARGLEKAGGRVSGVVTERGSVACDAVVLAGGAWSRDRKSTRLNSSHVAISYAVFCLIKKNRIVEVFIFMCHMLP